MAGSGEKERMKKGKERVMARRGLGCFRVKFAGTVDEKKPGKGATSTVRDGGQVERSPGSRSASPARPDPRSD